MVAKIFQHLTNQVAIRYEHEKNDTHDLTILQHAGSLRLAEVSNRQTAVD